jgi:hypothetical protein
VTKNTYKAPKGRKLSFSKYTSKILLCLCYQGQNQFRSFTLRDTGELKAEKAPHSSVGPEEKADGKKQNAVRMNKARMLSKSSQSPVTVRQMRHSSPTHTW